MHLEIGQEEFLRPILRNSRTTVSINCSAISPPQIMKKAPHFYKRMMNVGALSIFLKTEKQKMGNIYKGKAAPVFLFPIAFA